jgi:hypothetical protein
VIWLFSANAEEGNLTVDGTRLKEVMEVEMEMDDQEGREDGFI